MRNVRNSRQTLITVISITNIDFSHYFFFLLLLAQGVIMKPYTLSCCSYKLLKFPNIFKYPAAVVGLHYHPPCCRRELGMLKYHPVARVPDWTNTH